MKIVRVRWIDSNFRSGWALSHEVNDVEPLAMGGAVGFLKGDNGEAITLAMSIGDNGSTLGSLTIPKSSIVYMKEMRLK